ncbi:hypothetical protein [Pantoea sp. SOD02]|uniref:hypothetical protein n=1 Tax=Pantoea sp. SOD02 TaxID=2970818 RepID=UPI002157B62E|nr:hypothetical protein [Pantoea sp. SOD02]UVC29813.1 hypothetical protein NR302_02195 [Pantoea sp. SOD02]
MNLHNGVFISKMKIILILVAGALLTACQHKTQPAEIVDAALQPAEIQKQENSRLENCHSELESLKTINSEKYTQSKKQFDQLMQGTAQYAGIRSNVKSSTQETVDALYRYRVNLLCTEISNTLLNSLVTSERTPG